MTLPTSTESRTSPMTSTTIPHQARNLRRAGALIEGADAHLYTLPADILTARDGIVRLAAELDQPAPLDATAVENRYVTALVDAALAATDLPDASGVLDADRELAAYGRRAALLQRAIEQADAAFDSLIAGLSDTVIHDHLGPAVAEVMLGIVAAAQALPEDISAETILRASDKARKAWLSLDDLAARYDAIRRGATPLRLRTPAEWDHRGEREREGRDRPEPPRPHPEASVRSEWRRRAARPGHRAVPVPLAR